MADEVDYWEERRAPPSKIVMERRMQAANGMPPEQAVDTIGKLWCQNLILGSEFTTDLLRDAGRRYAMLYWHRFGPVCAGAAGLEPRIDNGHVSPVIGAGSFQDIIREEMFGARDDALRGCGARITIIVQRYCVDGQGDNDPAWLGPLISGYPYDTEAERLAFSEAVEARKKARGRTPRRIAAEHEAAASMALHAKLLFTRKRRVPWKELEQLRDGLLAMARVDKADGFHVIGRGAKKQA